MSVLPKAKLADIMQAVVDLGYFGKRILSSKLQVCETVISDLSLKVEPLAMSQWLDQNKPAKAAKSKAACTKPAANTMTGNEAHEAKQLAVLGGNCFIVTTAQNNTEVSSVFSKLVELSNKLECRLVVMPTYYNKTHLALL